MHLHESSKFDIKIRQRIPKIETETKKKNHKCDNMQCGKTSSKKITRLLETEEAYVSNE